MRTLHCIAVDDEPLALEVISDYCEKIDYLELIGKFTNPFEALNLIRKEPIDIIFLDIQMPELSGFGFVKSLKNSPYIIFTTAYKRYALESYDLNAVDYLLKPFSFERFFQSVDKVNERNEEKEIIENRQNAFQTDYIFVNYNNKIIKLLLDEIVYLKSDGDYIVVHTLKKEYLIREKMKNISDKLNSKLFIRVHKSFIVSLKQITELYGNIIKCGDIEIPVGHIYRNILYREIEKTKIG
jgi:DNA-binding LytR/AlgR family response regulator